MSERYAVKLSKRAAKELRKLDRPVQARIVAALALLRDDPRPATVKALVGHPGYLRVRVGDYRIVYTVHEGKLLVLVLTLGHRGAIYRDLP
ncbi:type II toxin-antitoxin system RelE/ParE family toxin [uncultured Kocuria sp.]|uniref:type II toxin-antitoxin system RelE family toxin n=1 Tax=uncultured Kocuria sp. TaxID=259305 RepID=UPI00262A0A23|nr:type II toxin-antitoxin system RelE/ParE family toxin [uncultured Kocuria sp.]